MSLVLIDYVVKYLQNKGVSMKFIILIVVIYLFCSKFDIKTKLYKLLRYIMSWFWSEAAFRKIFDNGNSNKYGTYATYTRKSYDET